MGVTDTSKQNEIAIYRTYRRNLEKLRNMNA